MDEITDICFTSLPNETHLPISEQTTDMTSFITCTSLRMLNVLGCKKLSNRSLELLSQYCFKDMENLSLKGCYQLQEETLIKVINSCSNKKLEKLILADCTGN